jgi:hypothetical protein
VTRFAVWSDKEQLSSVHRSTNRRVSPRKFLALVDQKHSVVVVSQTWSEIHKVNERVRSALKSRGLLGAEEQVP